MVGALVVRIFVKALVLGGGHGFKNVDTKLIFGTFHSTVDWVLCGCPCMGHVAPPHLPKSHATFSILIGSVIYLVNCYNVATCLYHINIIN